MRLSYTGEVRPPRSRPAWLREQQALLVLGLLLSFAAGFSILIFGSPMASLAIAGAVTALGSLAVLTQRPAWALYGAVLVPFLPLGLMPPHVQSLLNRLMLILATGLWLFDVATNDRPVIFLGPALFMLLFTTWSVSTLLWAPDFNQGIEGVFQYASRLALFLVVAVNQVNSRERLDGLMDAMAIGGWLLLILGVQQLVFRGLSSDGRLQVLEENINGYGILLLTMMPGVLWRTVRSARARRSWRTIFGFIYVISALVLVALTGSRGSVLSFVIALLLFGLWKPTRVWGILGLVIVLLAGAAAPFVFSSLIERTEEAAGFGGRLPIWQASWFLIRDRPWRGAGIANANEAVMPYLRMLTRTYGRTERAIHNPVLQVWAETGVPGLILYLAVLLSTVFVFARRYLRCRAKGACPLSAYYALVSSGFVGYLVSWIKGGGMEHAASYFLMLGLLLIPSRIPSTEGHADGHLPARSELGTKVVDA